MKTTEKTEKNEQKEEQNHGPSMDFSTSAVKQNKKKQHVSLVGFLILLKFTLKLQQRREKTMEKNGNSQLSNDLIWVNKERFFPRRRLCWELKIPSFRSVFNSPSS